MVALPPAVAVGNGSTVALVVVGALVQVPTVTVTE
jgi:hypothetical protein